MTPPPVGASLLAMVVNDYAGSLTPRGALGFIASRLAPTEGQKNPPESDDHGGFFYGRKFYR
ncbi:hypothetical protein PspS34_08705 [Pseudomonas sp. S34]|nr:hypothetical protein PspS34_08705 [Pseudomonas sp. S34]